jgi:uncharacterized MAPEG superfamily protein
MFSDTTVLALSAILTFLMLGTAAGLRTRSWQSGGIARNLGNRDNLDAPSPVAARADRAAKNMVENLLLFVALIAAAHFAGKANAQVQLGANIFFWSRVAYWPVYVAGIPALRTLIWLVGIAGLAIIACAVLY